jgi:hypothetical protein
VPHYDARYGGWGVSAAPATASSGQDGMDLTVQDRRRRAIGYRGPSLSTPIWRVVRPHTVGAPIPGHDVSGTDWQTLGGAMQSITTIVPVWQRGHARNDSPVNASKRSR